MRHNAEIGPACGVCHFRMIHNDGIRYLLAALSLACLIASAAWWRARAYPTARTFRIGALWTALALSLASITIALAVILSAEP